MTHCKRCGSGVAALCCGCAEEMAARQACVIEQLRAEIQYLHVRCAEEGVAVAFQYPMGFFPKVRK